MEGKVVSVLCLLVCIFVIATARDSGQQYGSPNAGQYQYAGQYPNGPNGRMLYPFGDGLGNGNPNMYGNGKPQGYPVIQGIPNGNGNGPQMQVQFGRPNPNYQPQNNNGPQNTGRKLRLLQVVRRHGSRAPWTAFPGDPYANTAWATGYGQLTLKGEKQMYDFGTYLRNTYPEILQQELKPAEIQVLSSIAERVINSALLNLAGIFPPTKNQVWSQDLGRMWRPVPVFTIPRDMDDLLYLPSKICPNLDKSRKDIKDSPIAKHVEAASQDLVQILKQNTQAKNLDDFWDGVYDVFDWVNCMQAEGLQLPAWITPDIIRRLNLIAGIQYHLMVGGNNDIQRTRLEGGPLINVLFNRFYGSFPSGNSTGDGKKFILYSAHDNTISVLLAAMKAYNFTETGPNLGVANYGSNVVFELYDDRTVRVRHKNNPNNMFDAPTTLVLPGCTEFCPLDQFRALLQPVIVPREQWLIECGLKPDNIKFPFDIPQGPLPQ